MPAFMAVGSSIPLGLDQESCAGRGVRPCGLTTLDASRASYRPATPEGAPDGAQVHDERHRPELATLYRLPELRRRTQDHCAHPPGSAEQPVIEKILTHFGRRPGRHLGRQFVARRCRWPAVAQPQPLRWPGGTGRWGRLRPRVRRTDESGRQTRNHPPEAPKKDGFRQRRQCSTVLRHLQRPSRTRRGPCSCRPGKEKRAFENPILRLPGRRAFARARPARGWACAWARRRPRPPPWPRSWPFTRALSDAPARRPLLIQP